MALRGEAAEGSEESSSRSAVLLNLGEQVAEGHEEERTEGEDDGAAQTEAGLRIRLREGRCGAQQCGSDSDRCGSGCAGSGAGSRDEGAAEDEDCGDSLAGDGPA